MEFFFWRIKVVHGHEWRSTLSNIFVGDAKTSSSVAAYLIHFRICDNPCQQWGYHGALSYSTNFSGMWNNLGAGLPSSLDTAAAQLPFQKHNHGELLCWISLLYFWQWAVEGWESPGVFTLVLTEYGNGELRAALFPPRRNGVCWLIAIGI